jgi:hypothetical protein
LRHWFAQSAEKRLFFAPKKLRPVVGLLHCKNGSIQYATKDFLSRIKRVSKYLVFVIWFELDTMLRKGDNYR